MSLIFKNKKAQYPGQVPQPNPFGSVHPVLIIGIIVCVIPFFNFILPFGFPKWTYGIGVFIILIGAGLSIWKGSQ